MPRFSDIALLGVPLIYVQLVSTESAGELCCRSNVARHHVSAQISLCERVGTLASRRVRSSQPARAPATAWDRLSKRDAPNMSGTV